MKLPLNVYKLLLCVVLILVIGGQSTLNPAHAQGTLTYTITVKGIGTAASQPDLAFVNVGVVVLNTSLPEGLTKANETITNITAALVTLKVAPADIQNAQVVVTPEDRLAPQIGPTGNFIFRIRRVLHVTLRDMTQIDQAINKAVEAGANVVSDLTFGISDTSRLEQAARAQAINDARQRAKILAESLNESVGDAVIVSETVTSTPPAAPGSIDLRGAATPDVTSANNTGQLIVTVQIEVTFTTRAQR